MGRCCKPCRPRGPGLLARIFGRKCRPKPRTETTNCRKYSHRPAVSREPGGDKVNIVSWKGSCGNETSDHRSDRTRATTIPEALSDLGFSGSGVRNFYGRHPQTNIDFCPAKDRAKYANQRVVIHPGECFEIDGDYVVHRGRDGSIRNRFAFDASWRRGRVAAA